jgi:hypothetical protein
MALGHVFGNARLCDLKSKLEQLAMNARRSPAPSCPARPLRLLYQWTLLAQPHDWVTEVHTSKNKHLASSASSWGAHGKRQPSLIGKKTPGGVLCVMRRFLFVECSKPQ